MWWSRKLMGALWIPLHAKVSPCAAPGVCRSPTEELRSRHVQGLGSALLPLMLFRVRLRPLEALSGSALPPSMLFRVRLRPLEAFSGWALLPSMLFRVRLRPLGTLFGQPLVLFRFRLRVFGSGSGTLGVFGSGSGTLRADWGLVWVSSTQGV